MAKLHSELRIKAVDNITGGSEGDPANYANGDIVYDLASGKFKKLDTGSWADAVTGVSADLSSTSIDALQDVDLSGISNGDILVWDSGSSSFVAQAPSSGATDSIVEGDTKVEVIDVGLEGGRIEFYTENAKKWEISTAGHILPATNNTFDIGSAELKVRDMYISTASLWVGDDHKVAISDGKMKFLKRRSDRVPSGAAATSGADFEPDLDGDLALIDPVGSIPATTKMKNFTLAQWEEYRRVRLIAGPIYDKDEALDWEQEESNIDTSIFNLSESGAVRKSFQVAVDNKQPSFLGTGGGSADAFYIEGIPHPEMRLKLGKYKFYQKHPSNSGHPLAFYSAEDKTGGPLGSGIKWGKDNLNTEYVDFAAYSTAFNAASAGDLLFEGFYCEITVDDTQVSEFFYECGAHDFMGWKIINEAASTGEAMPIDLSTPATAGQTLVWNNINNTFEPKDNSIDNLSDTTITDKGIGDALVWTGAEYENLHASELVRLTVLSHSQSWNAGGDPEVYEFAQHFLGRSGGRVLLNTTDFNPVGGDKIEISMGQLLAYNASWSAPSLNFEIFSKGTQPFDITLTNGTGSTQTLYSDFQSDIVIADGLSETLSVGEGQMVVLWTTGQYWYYQIRSGL